MARLIGIDQFKSFFAKHSQRLQMEFNLPAVDLLEQNAIRIMEHFLNKKISNLEECLQFIPRDLFQLASGLSVFSRSGSFIVEGYFISARAIRSLARSGKGSFFFGSIF